jgi:hypothetical protein
LREAGLEPVNIGPVDVAKAFAEPPTSKMLRNSIAMPENLRLADWRSAGKRIMFVIFIN